MIYKRWGQLNYKNMTLREQEELRLRAEKAVTSLKRYRTLYKQGTISLAVVKIVAGYPIELFNQYTKLKAKQHKVSYKPFNLSAFLR